MEAIFAEKYLSFRINQVFGKETSSECCSDTKMERATMWWGNVFKADASKFIDTEFDTVNTWRQVLSWFRQIKKPIGP